MDLNISSRVFSQKDLMPVIKELLDEGGFCELKVTGHSMTPTLKDKRDKVILVSKEKKVLKEGEIVLIKRNSQEYILHRIYKMVDNDYLIINGDAQIWDETVNTNQVIGIVDKILRKKKVISCDNLLYRFYVRIWMRLKPYRREIFKLWINLKKTIMKLKSWSMGEKICIK